MPTRTQGRSLMMGVAVVVVHEDDVKSEEDASCAGDEDESGCESCAHGGNEALSVQPLFFVFPLAATLTESSSRR